MQLWYATDNDSGELGHLKSVSFSGPRYDIVQSWSGHSIPVVRDAGEVVFEIELPPDVTGLDGLGPAVHLFNQRMPVEWTLEQPNGNTWGFKGYVSSVDTSLGMARGCRVAVKFFGPVTYYSDVAYVEETDNVPVLDKKSSKAQSVTYSEMLQKVLLPTPAPAPLSGYVEGDWMEEEREYDEAHFED